MRFVPTKEVEQQDIQALHRIRERLIGERTALVNEVHGLMNEYGIVIPKGVSKFRRAVVDKLERDKDKLTALSQELFWKLLEEFAVLEQQIAYYQEKLESLAKTHPECQRLMTIPEIGPITATALIAAVGDVGVFENDRQFAAWLGLVPKQYSTGGQTRLIMYEASPLNIPQWYAGGGKKINDIGGDLKCDSTPINISFTVVLIYTPARCTSAS